MSQKDRKSKKWLIGIDEAGEKVWETFARVRYDLSHIARLSEKLCFQKVDSSCKECLVFFEFAKEMATTCTVPVRKGSTCKYGK